MSRKQIKIIEDRLDADYAGCFPSCDGWEKVAAHLLLAYDTGVRCADTRTIDKMKYALMHALRWGKTAPSCRFRGDPDELNTTLFEACVGLLDRGIEYTGICGAFISYYQRLVKLDSIGTDRIGFTSCPSWKAYDVLDEHLSFQGTRSTAQLSQDIQTIAAEFAATLNPQRANELKNWFPDFGTARSLLSPVNAAVSDSFQLPSSFSIEGISIIQLRAFWRAIMILALIHRAFGLCLTGLESTGMIQLFVKRRSDLVDWICGSVGLDQKIVSRILDFHIYDRADRIRDIALTPFLPLSDGLMAASPRLLASSAFERSFCAYAARQYERAYSNASNVLAPHLAEDLVAAFTKAGYRATHSIPFKLDEYQGDVDLLVWSAHERYLMAAELKWFIGTADFMEVLHREKTVCKEAMKSQLPKYSKLLAEDAGAFTGKAFQLRSSPRIDDWSCGALVRGFVGSPRIPDEEYFFLPERLVQAGLRECGSLRELCKWARNKPYLPVEGQNFQMYPYEVTSPSDIHVRFWEWEEMANDAASANQ